MYGNLTTPTLLIAGSKSKFIGVNFQSTTKLTAPQYPVPYPEVGTSRGAA